MPTAMGWYAAIDLPEFALQAALRLREEVSARAVAVVEGSTVKGHVLEVTPAAARSGVLRGMNSTQARARCPELELWARSVSGEQVAAALLLEVGHAFSPFVEDTSPGLCLLDLRQVKTDDWEAWAGRIVERCQGVCLRARVGLGPNADLAALAAARARPVLCVRHPAAFLAGIAVGEIDAAPDLLAVLRDWGIAHLGDLARLSRKDLTERLGPDAGALWERAAGRRHRELRLVRPPEVYREAFDFEHAVETTEPLLFILRRQLEQLTVRLREGWRVAASMRMTLVLDGTAEVHERVFSIPSPTADVGALERILHTYLESLRLEHRPTGIRLAMEPALQGSQELQLFESPLRDPNRFGETLARLAAVSGVESVGVVQMADSHRPDAFQVVPPRFEKLSAPAEAPPRSHALGLPLRRYRPPFPAQVRVERLVPAWVFSESAHGEVADAAGPYRLSGDWWDADTWSVEEWDIALDNGELYRLSKHGDAWKVEGFYDAPVR